MLPKTELGSTGMMVTKLGFGALELRALESDGGRLPSIEHGERLLNAVLDAGINFIDTAPSYGRSEEFIGRAIANRRDEYFLATKAGRGWRSDPPGGSELSREALASSLDHSLALMRTDHVDILQVHGGSVEEIEQHGCIETLRDLRAQGKTRFIGASATLPDLDRYIDMDVFDTFQIVYSALEPEHWASISRAAERGAGTIIRGGAVKGAPTRATGRGNEFPTVRRRGERSGLDRLLAGLDPVETLLRYAIAHTSAHTFIVGTRDSDHLRANVAAVEKGPLDGELHEAIRAEVEAVAG